VAANLTDLKNSQKNSIDKYLTEIERFNKICEEQDNVIRSLTEEKTDFLNRNDDLNHELKSVISKLKSREENLSFTQRQLDEANKNISKMENHIAELDQNLNRTKIELKTQIIIILKKELLE